MHACTNALRTLRSRRHNWKLWKQQRILRPLKYASGRPHLGFSCLCHKTDRYDSSKRKKKPSTRKGWGMVAKDIYDEVWKRLLLLEESRLQYTSRILQEIVDYSIPFLYFLYTPKDHLVYFGDCRDCSTYCVNWVYIWWASGDRSAYFGDRGDWLV